MTIISNPILKGFNPDPSIVRVNDDYYIATSTFEWFPGVQIHHSKDLVNWKLITHPLTKTSQLDMKGVPDSCGVWAPCLTHHEGIFYLIYTNVKNFNGDWKDTPNFVVTAPDIKGPWSEPSFINSSGFDPSLFHDDDGKSYCLNMMVDHRNSKFFGGIIMQEFDRTTKKLVGKIHHIFSGSEHGLTEGPHLYKKNGYYYLLTAEGGTSYDHCVSLARSKSIFGPYDIHPNNPIVTSAKSPSNYLQKTGHGDLVETQQGEWYMVFLTGRPLTEQGRCITGRETAIEKVEWHQDNWLYLSNKTQVARQKVEAPNLPAHKFTADKKQINFDTANIDINFQSLRVPMTKDWVNQTDRQGYLRLVGRESLSSCFEQSMIARRVQEHHTVSSTCIEFSPENFQQMAGLTCYYNTTHYHYLYITGDDMGASSGINSGASSGTYTSKKFLNILSCNDNKTSHPLSQPIDVSNIDKIYLKADFNGEIIQFYYAISTEKSDPTWQKIGPELDGSILSDDYVVHTERGYSPCFTGAFIGLACQDLSGQKIHADFESFTYQEIT